MYLHQQQFLSGEGIVAPNADETVRNIGRIASEGMIETDQTIISIMQKD